MVLCERAAAAHAERPSAKLRFDPSTLDAANLYGSTDARRALDFGFRIPDRSEAVAEVREIDAGVRVHRARGRIGCAASERPCIGATRQPGFRELLAALARLSYVARIELAFF